MVTVRFLDAQWCRMRDDCGRRARHLPAEQEIDHLDGILFIDHISKLKRDRITRKFKKDAKRKAEEKDEARRKDGDGVELVSGLPGERAPSGVSEKMAFRRENAAYKVEHGLPENSRLW